MPYNKINKHIEIVSKVLKLKNKIILFTLNIYGVAAVSKNIKKYKNKKCKLEPIISKINFKITKYPKTE